MPVDSKVGRRHWGWLILLVTFRKFQHFNLVSKIFQKLFKPLPCHKSIGKMLHAICISAVAVSLRWASCGPWASCSYFSTKTCCGYTLEAPRWGVSNEYPQHMFLLRNKKDSIFRMKNAPYLLLCDSGRILLFLCWLFVGLSFHFGMITWINSMDFHQFWVVCW